MYIIWNVEFNTIFFEKMCLLSPLNAKYKVKDMPVCILHTCLTSISHLGLFFFCQGCLARAGETEFVL